MPTTGTTVALMKADQIRTLVGLIKNECAGKKTVCYRYLGENEHTED